MDESEALKIGMEVALRPLTQIAENALGLAGGDWLSEKRLRNRQRLREETEKILQAEGADLDDDPSPSVVIPLLQAAQDESREEMLKLWATLMATAMDPNRRSLYRRQFVDLVKNLEPGDALMLPHIPEAGENWYNSSRIAEILKLPYDEAQTAMEHLIELGIMKDNSDRVHGEQYGSSALGRLLRNALNMSKP